MATANADYHNRKWISWLQNLLLSSRKAAKTHQFSMSLVKYTAITFKTTAIVTVFGFVQSLHRHRGSMDRNGKSGNTITAEESRGFQVRLISM